MTKPALIFASVVTLAGSAIVATALMTWPPLQAGAFVVVFALALLAATFKVRMPGMTSAISPVAVPILFAAGTLGWQAAALIAALSAIVFCLWRASVRPSVLQLSFNSATMAISVVAATVFANLVTPPGAFVWFVAAAIIFQIVNALLVSVVLSLLGQGVSLSVLWRNCHLWSFPYEITAGVFAGLWAQAQPIAANNALLGAMVLAATLLYLMSVFYREIVDRTTAGVRVSIS